MIPKISVICCIYNSQPLARRAIESLVNATEFRKSQVEIVLVDNHSPDERVRDDIFRLAMFLDVPHFRVVDPGKNLGCHGGWNFGYQHIHPESKYVCKFDDDTEILTQGWAEKMTEALIKIPELGFISADIDAKQNNVYSPRTVNGIDIEVAITGVVGFSFVMFRRSDIERWGPMKTGPYCAAGGKPVMTERLYGGEEVYYADHARSEGKLIAHFPSVKCHHMDNSERHPDYPGWKFFYGYYAWTNKDMADWLASGEAVGHYRKAIVLQLTERIPNEALLAMWVLRLKEFGESKDVELLHAVKSKTKNGVLLANCDVAIDALRNVRK